MSDRHLFVSWSLPSSRGQRVMYLLELVETPLASGRTIWELEREVILRSDGRVRSKSPTTDDPWPHAEERPDPIEAIERGDMTEILPVEFERYWSMPIYHRPGPLRRLLMRYRPR
jgi:hypothetical protein